jgi:hypothetical protein
VVTNITRTTIAIWLTVVSSVGCVTQGSGLEALKAQQRHELYTRCVDTQMKLSSFGSGMAVHQACLYWAQSRI